MQIILLLPTEGLTAETNPRALFGILRVLREVCKVELVVSLSGLGGLIADDLEEQGIPFKITRSDITIMHGEFEIVDGKKQVVGVRFKEHI